MKALHQAVGRVHPREAAPAAALAVGSCVYALIQGVGKADFVLTPLLVGVIVIAAGVLAPRRRRRVVGTGLVLGAWGAAVLLVDRDVVPRERTTPAYMLGVGVGLLVTALLAGRRDRGDWLTSGCVAAFNAPLALYLASDMDGFGRWPAWALALLAMAGWELLWALRTARSEPAGAGRLPP